MKQSILGFYPEEIVSALCLDKKYRANQILKAVYSGADKFENITTLSVGLRDRLFENHTIFDSAISNLLKDQEGNGKLSLTLSDNNIIECIMLSDNKGRKTACLSTQAGCAMGCQFCKTAEGGFFRNLTASEIIQQYLHLKNNFGSISNIVFMGMGEPLLNTENLFKAVDILSRSEGAGMASRRITVSTCGLADKISMIAEQGPHFRLALSLNSAIQEKREHIMPIAKKFPLPELKNALLYYQKKRGKRITLEYVLLKDFNTKSIDVRKLAEFADSLSAIVNVIPWNPAPSLDFKSPTPEEIAKFCRLLEKAGVTYTLRRSRGQKIEGACGQLASQ